jgi:hypothetical protein
MNGLLDDNGQLLVLGSIAVLVGLTAVLQRGSSAVFDFESPSHAGFQLGTEHTSRGGEALANWRWHHNPIYKDDPGAARSGPRGRTRKSRQ